MSRRKQPRVSKALRDAATERMVERLSSDINRLAKVEVQHQFGTTQTLPPPASGWRSMASAPKDGSSFLGVAGKYSVVRIGYVCADGEHFRTENDSLFRLDEMHAWALIPEWTGEVTE